MPPCPLAPGSPGPTAAVGGRREHEAPVAAWQEVGWFRWTWGTDPLWEKPTDRGLGFEEDVAGYWRGWPQCPSSKPQAPACSPASRSL